MNGPEPSGAATGSTAAHVGLWIRTKKGNVAHILADPKMCRRTWDALAAVIDAAAKAAADGTLKERPNIVLGHGTTEAEPRKPK